MRLLFTFAGGAGHADPLLPVAEAARAAGHTVAFCGDAVAAGSGEPGGSTSRPATIGPLLPPSRAREDRVLREHYAGRLACARAERVLALAADWAPDAIVCDETDFGAMIAAERAGVPHATVLVTAAGSFVRPAVVVAALDELRAKHGLPTDPGLDMLGRHLVLSPFPPSFRDPAFPLPATAHSFRTQACERRTGEPTVYVTLGTVFNLESGDLFTRVLAGLRGLPMNVIATVGRQLDPSAFGPQPDNVRIESYVPQSDLLSRCDIVVSHGGSGTIAGTLAAGLPSVLLPMGADQPHNADRCEALRLGVALDPVRATPSAVREAVLAVLADRSYRAAAERMRAEMAELPGPGRAVRLIEVTARAGAPASAGAAAADRSSTPRGPARGPSH